MLVIVVVNVTRGEVSRGVNMAMSCVRTEEGRGAQMPRREQVGGLGGGGV